MVLIGVQWHTVKDTHTHINQTYAHTYRLIHIKLPICTHIHIHTHSYRTQGYLYCHPRNGFLSMWLPGTARFLHIPARKPVERFLLPRRDSPRTCVAHSPASFSCNGTVLSTIRHDRGPETDSVRAPLRRVAETEARPAHWCVHGSDGGGERSSQGSSRRWTAVIYGFLIAARHKSSVALIEKRKESSNQ